MAETDQVFAGSIPENYDRYMVPLIFADYADELARRAVAMSPGSVLETATGTGVVTRAMANLLEPDVAYTATDLNQPMLDFASARQGTDNRIVWRMADAQALPFPDGTFDLVCCQFGAMFFPNRPSAYREARRVLKPGGSFLFNVWDRIEENYFAKDITDTLAQMFPADPPRFLARTPHGYHDTTQICSDLATAGYSNVAIETVAKQSRASSPQHPAIAYCQGTPLRNEIEARAAGSLGEATDRAVAAIGSKYGTGEIAAKIQAHIVTARA